MAGTCQHTRCLLFVSPLPRGPKHCVTPRECLDRASMMAAAQTAISCCRRPGKQSPHPGIVCALASQDGGAGGAAHREVGDVCRGGTGQQHVVSISHCMEPAMFAAGVASTMREAGSRHGSVTAGRQERRSCQRADNLLERTHSW